ncbi:MAG: IPT/TIG domain-containing protein [Pseudonocardiaceae bacterium]
MQIDSITPNSALPDTPVIIKGDGLDAADKLLFGDESVPFKVTKTGSIEANVPSGSGTLDVTAELPDGDKSNSVSFTFLAIS